MPRRNIPAHAFVQLEKLVAGGMSIAQAARTVGMHRQTAERHLRGSRTQYQKAVKQFEAYQEATSEANVIPLGRVGRDAKRALEDFELFRRRYLGHYSTPWQLEAAYQIRGLLESPEKVYSVINCPPGSGKSTLFTLDIPLWLICRNRALRCLVGSHSERKAKEFTSRIRRELERRVPLAEPSYQAEQTLIRDFGRFKPLDMGEAWRVESFTVAQHGEVSVADKEPTVSAYGLDQEFLGGRYDLIVWDDAATERNQRNADMREKQQNWWVREAESRLEPGGALILMGQRIMSDDLYHFCLQQKEFVTPDMMIDDALAAGEACLAVNDRQGALAALTPLWDEQLDLDAEEIPFDLRPPKYLHVVFQAHYEDRCVREHGRDARPYPDGCLLDPQRLSWRELATKKATSPQAYSTWYQQEDSDPTHVLVDPLWVTGGRDTDGVEYPGCWDTGRGLFEAPPGLSAPVLSIATADPSPTKFWSVQWWLVHPETQQRFLMALLRQSMDAPDFLDYNPLTHDWYGIMHEWQQISRDIGYPISHWVVESNAAQRFLLQYKNVQLWRSKFGVNVIPHQTGRNKSDEKFGVQSIAPHWQFGRVRLPGKGDARLGSLKLVDEVTHYPDGSTDDCVMAQWFLEWNLPRISVRPAVVPKQKRPSWVRAARPILAGMR